MGMRPERGLHSAPGFFGCCEFCRIYAALLSKRAGR